MRLAAILIDKINMQESDWIEAKAAMALLGVRRQTLYAYVSRGLLRVSRDPARKGRSLYHHQDLRDLAQAHARPRARAEVAAKAIDWGEPLLTSSISQVVDGELYFGALSARLCAEKMTLEDMAAHHWRCDRLPPAAALLLRNGDNLGQPIERAMVFLAQAMGESRPLAQGPREVHLAEAMALLAGLLRAFVGDQGGGAVHEQLARAWRLGPEGAEGLRRALVLLSDHELNPSTFALRVCASTGAGLAASVLAALATLSGPKHGGVAALARRALRAAMKGEAALEAFLQEHQGLSPYGFGFSHPLYPKGDPRAQALLASGYGAGPAGAALALMARHLGEPPNIDGALAVLGERHDLPEEAAFILFCLGRFTGWVAHALEQSASGQIIRPRARYVKAPAAKPQDLRPRGG